MRFSCGNTPVEKLDYTCSQSLWKAGLGSKEGVGILGYRLAFREENTPDQESPSLE